MPCSFGGLIGTDNEDEPQEARQAIPGNDDRRASQSNGGVRQGVRCRQGSALVSANATPLGTGQGQVAPFQKAPPAERVDLARLSTTERIVVLVSRANFEVELGGLSAFFYNSAGNYAAERYTLRRRCGRLWPCSPAAHRRRIESGGIRLGGQWRRRLARWIKSLAGTSRTSSLAFAHLSRVMRRNCGSMEPRVNRGALRPRQTAGNS